MCAVLEICNIKLHVRSRMRNIFSLVYLPCRAVPCECMLAASPLLVICVKNPDLPYVTEVGLWINAKDVVRRKAHFYLASFFGAHHIKKVDLRERFADRQTRTRSMHFLKPVIIARLKKAVLIPPTRDRHCSTLRYVLMQIKDV